MIMNRISPEIKREACSEFWLTKLQKLHYASPPFPFDVFKYVSFQTFVLTDFFFFLIILAALSVCNLHTNYFNLPIVITLQEFYLAT